MEHSHVEVIAPTLIPFRGSFEHEGIKVKILENGISFYFKGELLLSISLPNKARVRMNPFDRSLVISSPNVVILVKRCPLSIFIYFENSGYVNAYFANLAESNVGYYVFRIKEISGKLILIGSSFSNGKIFGKAGSSAIISIMWGKGPSLPIGLMKKIRAQISLMGSGKKVQVSVYSSYNFTVPQVRMTSFGIQLKINWSPPGVIEVSMPHTMSKGNVMVMYNGMPIWRAENPKELNYSEESFWSTASGNATIVYLKVSNGGTVYIVPERKMIELKALGVGIGSAISAGLLFVLFRRL